MKRHDWELVVLVVLFLLFVGWFYVLCGLILDIAKMALLEPF